MVVSTNTFSSDTIKFIRDDLFNNITDPISGARAGRDRFVMTSYPQRPTKYPLITVRSRGPTDVRRLGMGSELHYVNIPVEVRIWARNEKEKDELTEQVYNRLRDNQFGTGTSSAQELHDFEITNSIPIDIVDDAEGGDAVIKSLILNVQYRFVLGA